MKRHCELCEDNAGGLYLEEYEETETEHKLLACIYYSPMDADQAGQDWLDILTNGADPYALQWYGLMPPSDLLQYEYAPYERNKTIASTNWGEAYPLGFDLECCGNAGREAGMSAGAFYRCPDCGETTNAVMDARRRYVCPETCPCCGESMY